MKQKNEDRAGRKVPVLFALGSWGDENVRGVRGGRRVRKPLMPIPALFPQTPVASGPNTEPDRIHQQPPAPQGLLVSLPKECPPGTF